MDAISDVADQEVIRLTSVKGGDYIFPDIALRKCVASLDELHNSKKLDEGDGWFAVLLGCPLTKEQIPSCQSVVVLDPQDDHESGRRIIQEKLDRNGLSIHGIWASRDSFFGNSPLMYFAWVFPEGFDIQSDAVLIVSDINDPVQTHKIIAKKGLLLLDIRFPTTGKVGQVNHLYVPDMSKESHAENAKRAAESAWAEELAETLKLNHETLEIRKTFHVIHIQFFFSEA